MRESIRSRVPVDLRPARSRRRLACVRLLAALFLSGAPVASAPAQGFGRNKVQYDTFDWHVLVTEHLEIHFYPEEEALARRAADYGEAACRRLDRDLGIRLSRKVPLIVYGSHYHFRQNNVTPSLVGESTGGFTEVFRNRVAIPYAGSEKDFRHVIHHELVHAYVFDRLYGGPIKSLFVLQYAFYIPLWFMEGMAEYYSNEWDSESEMMLRDAAISGALPPFDRIHGGYFVYKSGWSAIGYLVDRHGPDVVPRILDELSETRDLRVAIHDVTGESLGAISEDWVKDVRRSAWPTYAHLDGPSRIGRLLTHHGPEQGTLNASGVLSPDGSRIAFLSNRSGTPDLWVQDVAGEEPPRVLVHGARGGEFESLHPLRSSFGWSPDGRYLVAAAQKGARDALYVLDAADGRTLAELLPDLDAVERPDWSPVDARFVFTGLKDGQVDLWTMDADGSRLARLTNDLAREEAPRFSPDGRSIVFSSDAAESTGKDLWTVNVETKEARPLRTAPGDQWDPCWSADGGTVFHASDEHGTRDLIAYSPADGSARRLTSLVGGADSPSVARGGDALVFTAFHEGGWDIVLVEHADSLEEVLAPSVFFPAVPWRGHTPPDPAVADSAVVATAPDTDAGADGDASDGEDTEPYVTDYHPRFRSEWITGALLYDGFGANAAISAAVSDVLGNHRFRIGANLFRSVENTDVVGTYSYLPGRIDWSVGAFHVKDNLFDDRTTLGQPLGEEGDDTLFSERRWGFLAAAVYPVHTFRRFGLEVTAMEVQRDVLENDSTAESFRGRLVLPRVHHAFDNTLWGWTGPVQGRRWIASFQQSLPVSGDRLWFGTALVDLRSYHRFSGDYVFALRGFAASSFGPDPQQFQIGGPNTVRGYSRQQFRGRNAALLSAEFRYPFVEYVKLGWPFRAAFGGIRGDLFLDVGAAFDRPADFRPAGRTADGRSGLEDLHVGFGFGARTRIAYLPLRVDVGWPTDLATTGAPVWHFTIAPEF